jgi:hypothetical protein
LWLFGGYDGCGRGCVSGCGGCFGDYDVVGGAVFICGSGGGFNCDGFIWGFCVLDDYSGSSCVAYDGGGYVCFVSALETNNLTVCILLV